MKVGYIRSSTKEQKHTPKNQEEELRKHGFTKFFHEEGVSSDTNLTTGQGWRRLQEFLSANPGTVVGITRQDRLGREWDLVGYHIGQLIRAGHSLHILDKNLVVDSLDILATNFQIAINSVADKDEKVKIKARTKETLAYLKTKKVKLGRKPLLSDRDCDEIRKFAESSGLGPRALSKEVTKPRLDSETGKWEEKLVSENTIRKVLAGTYYSEDEWLAHNASARTKAGLRLSATNLAVRGADA